MSYGRWGALKSLAERQYGLFSSTQASLNGVSNDVLLSACRRGWLYRARRGVYGFAGNPRSIWVPAVAAGLAGGSCATLSHSTAAAIYGFGRADPAIPELTVPNTQRRCLEGVILHRAGPLDPTDRRQKHGVGVTSPARTVVDLATFLEAPALERVLDDGAIRRLYTYSEVAASLFRASHRSGAPTLRELLRHRVGEPIPDSFLERRIFDVLAPYRPFEVHFQVVSRGRVMILDAAWPAWKVGAEIDGRTQRALSRKEFDRERARGNVLVADGWRVAHLTSTMSDGDILLSVGWLLPQELAGPVISRIVGVSGDRIGRGETNRSNTGVNSP